LLNAGASVYVADIAKCPPELQSESKLHYKDNCDITSREACKAFINSIAGRLDALVNCAGICPHEGKMASDELFARIMAINVTGSWNMGTEAIRKMTEQHGSSAPGLLPGTERSLGAGTIINIASGASLRGIAGLGAYCTSKHAVLGMTRSWAKEWPSLRVNAVAPGKRSSISVRVYLIKKY
jgi:NAD(P)-dependent dehydrogenase (short-subunit alcohol dehydrogenase family)